jgi:hypothetical protein
LARKNLYTPSKQEACTAIITRIKDVSIGNEDTNIPFKTVVTFKDASKASYDNLTYKDMERLNSDNDVSVIEITGDIPFVSAEDVSLVLIDTPGPNNARDDRHLKVQNELLGKSSKSLVIYIMTGEFGTDDDNTLLHRVADSMAVGGKQSKDRFIFVVNKLDDRKKEDGDTKQTLDRVREYLKNHGILNPNLFPAAALPALNIRLIENGADVDDDTVDETETKVRKLNRNESLHFEAYAPLPQSIRNEIDENIHIMRSNWVKSGKNILENPQEALIHTGIISIEAAIRQYVQKYAKTAKVKNVVDTFIHKIEEVKIFEKLKNKCAEQKKGIDEIINIIDSIKSEIYDGKNAKKFAEDVDNITNSFKPKSVDVIEGIIQKFQNKLSDYIFNKNISTNDFERELDSLKNFAKSLEKEFQVDLEELIRNDLIYIGNSLIKEYKNKLSSLVEQITIDNEIVTIDPLQIMQGSLDLVNLLSDTYKIEDKVPDGEEWVENYNKAWYKPWTWLQESGYYRKKYKTVEYLDVSKMAQDYLAPIGKFLRENQKAALAFAIEQSKKIAINFKNEVNRLDEVLNEKLSLLNNYVKDKDQANKRLKETEENLKWLNYIKSEVEQILEI